MWDLSSKYRLIYSIRSRKHVNCYSLNRSSWIYHNLQVVVSLSSWIWSICLVMWTESDEVGADEVVPHPAGIVLRRVGYYTIPSMEDLAKLYETEGHCIVDNFTVGRYNYGNIFFPDRFNVAGINIDEIGKLSEKPWNCFFTFCSVKIRQMSLLSWNFLNCYDIANFQCLLRGCLFER